MTLEEHHGKGRQMCEDDQFYRYDMRQERAAQDS